MGEIIMICQICGVTMKNFNYLSKHIRFHHPEESSKGYYDKYLKKESDGKCIICCKNTKWKNINIGYSLTCGHKCGCKYHRNNLKRNPDKMNSFIEKVKKNQFRIWHNREIDGTKDTILDGVIKKLHKYMNGLDVNGRKSTYGWLNKLNPEEKSIKIQEILENSLFKFYNQASDEDKRKIVEKRIMTRIKNGTMSDPSLKTEFEKYYSKVKSITEKNYKKYKNIIDPENLRSVYFHLDHKISILFGFITNIHPDIISHHLNLQILPRPENLKKKAKCSMSLEDLINNIEKLNYDKSS